MLKDKPIQMSLPINNLNQLQERPELVFQYIKKKVGSFKLVIFFIWYIVSVLLYLYAYKNDIVEIYGFIITLILMIILGLPCFDDKISAIDMKNNEFMYFITVILAFMVLYLDLIILASFIEKYIYLME
ncbi:hypothetical protein GVAV_000605 [Gurleya vavrai]